MTWSVTVYIPVHVTYIGSPLEQEFLQNPSPAQLRSYENMDEQPNPSEWFERSYASPLCLWAEHTWGEYPGDKAVSIEFEASVLSIVGIKRFVECIGEMGITSFVFGRTGEKHLPYTLSNCDALFSSLES